MATWRDRLTELARTGAAIGSEVLKDFAAADLRKAQTQPKTGEGNETAPGGSSQDSAKNSPAPTDPPEKPPQSLLFDPFAVVEQLGYKERPSQISYGTLRAMCWRMPIIQAVVKARVDQAAAFARVQQDRFQYGFRVQLRETKKSPTKIETKFSESMEQFMLRTGVTENPRGRDGFGSFLKKTLWDSLVYDQMAWEIIPNRKNEPAQFLAVDASSIRLADITQARMAYEDPEQVRYVQVYDGIVINEYSVEELAFGIRNPRSDMQIYGYGTSELEMLAQAVTALLYSWDYNSRFFSQGSTAKGILNLKGNIPDSQLTSFRRHWYTNLSSVENAWRTPVVNANEGMEWINLQQNNRDMEFSAWMDFLLKVTCAMYSMDPIEINFKYGNSGQRSAMNEAGNREKIIESRERGLRPLLEFVAQQINLHVMWPINEAFELKFVGLDARTPEEQAELNSKRVKTYVTVNELRAEEDMDPIEHGDMILDPTYMQAKGAAEMQAQGGMDGEGGPDGGDDDFDFGSLFSQFEGDADDTGDEKKDDVEKSLLRVVV